MSIVESVATASSNAIPTRVQYLNRLFGITGHSLVRCVVLLVFLFFVLHYYLLQVFKQSLHACYTRPILQFN